MKQISLTVLIAVGVVLGSVSGYAQDAALSGTITDSTGGVLPGVTVTALHEDSGNTFVGVTDAGGAYRLPLRTGKFIIKAELPGFGTVTRRLELVVGQQGVLNLQMSPSAVQESVTVTGEAPLVDVSQSKLGGNIDTRQMQEIPVNGRNWMSLTLLVPGSRANAVTETPVDVSSTSGMSFQLNIDGQQVSNSVGAGTPRLISRDALGEFELITNRFDATQGRSTGVQVNAVTKAGTNLFAGTLSGYFRSDRFNAADFVVHRVLPYSDQQAVATFGGPIRKDKAHFFGYYEHERQPQTLVFTSPFPRFNVDLTDTEVEDKYGARIDLQFTPRTHLAVRGNRWTHDQPFYGNAGGANVHPSAVIGKTESSDQIWLSFTQTLGEKTVNEIKAGYNHFLVAPDAYAGFARIGQVDGCAAQQRIAVSANAPGLLIPLDGAAPYILLRGYTIGERNDPPWCISASPLEFRDDFTYLLSAAGRHEFKIGGEYLRNPQHLFFDNLEHGQLDATGGPIPANIEDLLPVWNDWRTWNIAALSPIVRSYKKSFGTYIIDDPRDTAAAWLQDNWTVTQRLTLNLGVRWDMSLGAVGDRIDTPVPPLFPSLASLPDHELLDIVPRVGFAYSLRNARTVIRGGAGRYYGEPADNPVHWAKIAVNTLVPTTLNDGRPNFAADPYNGQVLTRESILASGVRLDGSGRPLVPGYASTYSNQASVGFQQQIGQTMSVQADYVWRGSRREGNVKNANLGYNPATGVNYPYTDISHLPYPDWGTAGAYYSDGWSNYHGLETAFSKRFSNRWQASATYTLSGLWDAVGAPDVGFKVAPDLGGEYTLAATDQRHRAVFNGIWQLGYGLQLSGLYFYGSGQRFATGYGGDFRNIGVFQGAPLGRLRPDGTLVPRNNFVGLPIHRVDLRVQRRFPIVGRAGVDGMLEVFNLFNHANYGAYNTVEALGLAAYGKAAQNTNVAYQPRMLQLGFRVAF